jgi:Rab-like protein 5
VIHSKQTTQNKLIHGTDLPLYVLQAYRLGYMYRYVQFVQQQGLKDSQTMIVFNMKGPSSPDKVQLKLSPRLSNVSQFVTNLEDDPEALRGEFNRFLSYILGVVAEKRDQEELSIMNN